MDHRISRSEPAPRTKSATGFHLDDSASGGCARHVWRLTEKPWNGPAHSRYLLSRRTVPWWWNLKKPKAQTQFFKPASPSELEQILFVLKVNKRGQQSKYFHSRNGARRTGAPQSAEAAWLRFRKRPAPSRFLLLSHLHRVSSNVRRLHQRSHWSTLAWWFPVFSSCGHRCCFCALCALLFIYFLFSYSCSTYSGDACWVFSLCNFYSFLLTYK